MENLKTLEEKIKQKLKDLLKKTNLGEFNTKPYYASIKTLEKCVDRLEN